MKRNRAVNNSEDWHHVSPLALVSVNHLSLILNLTVLFTLSTVKTGIFQCIIV